jgi:hypothetical protein
MQPIITAYNGYQSNLHGDTGPSLGNLPMVGPTIFDMNTVLSGGQDVFGATHVDPPFGTHISEAVAIVKDWMHDR